MMAAVEKFLHSKEEAVFARAALAQPCLLTTEEAAEYLHKPTGTLRYWRSIGFGPAYAKLGKTVVYDLADLVSFIKSNTIRPSVRDASMEVANGAL